MEKYQENFVVWKGKRNLLVFLVLYVDMAAKVNINKVCVERGIDMSAMVNSHSWKYGHYAFEYELDFTLICVLECI